MITIINIRKEGQPYIYCGRGTALGNPYVLGKDGNRDEVCDKYESAFKKMTEQAHYASPFAIQLAKIEAEARKGDVRLGCYCAPQRCHCETIKHYIETKLLGE